ncbi:MAG: GNAT family N-acetyltransferase, partial [Stellaceae bacterium]
MMAERTLEWRVEETCLNAWPALREVLLDGWVLRFSEGLTRRSNSANPLRPVSHTDLRTCEVLYRRLGLPTIFRVLSLIDPRVDERLAEAGYTGEGESCVLYAAIDDIAAARDPDVKLLDQPTPEWFDAMAALQNHSSEQAATYRRIVGRLAVPAAFAALSDEGGTAALAYGALHNSCLCYESVITDRRRRRQGWGRRTVNALTAWARDEGAVGACLEVEAHNG